MTRKEFYNEILKLAPSEYDASKCEFPKHLKYILNSYYKLLDELEESERPDVGFATWEETKQMIRDLNDAINKSVDLNYNGLYSDAFSRLSDAIKKEYHNAETDEQIEEAFVLRYFFGKDYYRMRMFDEGEKHDRNGMFHIPFDKRTIVKTQRFSVPGSPCLYMGTSVYVCWEENHKPNLDKCYVSRFQSIDRFSPSFCDMSLPLIDDIMKADEQKFRHILLRLPLILACMVKVAKPDDPFKPEYIIPQLFMEYIKGSFYKENDPFCGIAYTSVRKSADYDFNPDKSINIAIPTTSSGKKFSEELCNLFQLTEPTCYELERAKCPYQVIERDEKMSDLEYNYRISTFGQLEARLKDKTKFPLDKIDNSTFGS